MATPYLTKSRYLAGLQCGRRLWRLVHDPHPYEAPAPGSTFEVGEQIGLSARLLFPGGVPVLAEPWQHAEAVAQTVALMGNPLVPAIFEAAFEHDGIRIRVDVLNRNVDGSWDLVEVKSSTGLKDHYIDDVALQVFVLQGQNVLLSSVELFHVNNTYVRGPNGVDWDQFFARLDIGDAVNDGSTVYRPIWPLLGKALRRQVCPSPNLASNVALRMSASFGTNVPKANQRIGLRNCLDSLQARRPSWRRSKSSR
jgi:hypothetical protein